MDDTVLQEIQVVKKKVVNTLSKRLVIAITF